MEALDEDGNVLGYLSERDCKNLGLKVRQAAPPPRYSSDPYLIYHADLLYQQGRLNSGADINPIQAALLIGKTLLDRRNEAKEQEARFLEQMFITNPEMYKAYMETKRSAEDGYFDIDETEWGDPEDFEDAQALIDAWPDAASDKNDEPESVRDWLEPDDLALMGD